MQKLKRTKVHTASVIIQAFCHNRNHQRSRALALGLMLKTAVLMLLLLTNFAFAQKSDKKSALSAEDRDKVNTYFFEGISQKNQKNIEAAGKAFNRVIEIDPKNDAAYYELAQLYYGAQSFDRANYYAQKAYELNDKNDWYINFLAKTEESLSRFDKAEILYQRLLKLYPEKINFYFDLASMHLYQNEFKEAIKVYDQIEMKMGVSEELSIQKQKIWLKLGNIDKAAQEISKLIENDPRDVKYRIMLVDLYLANDLYEKAGKALNEALTIEPDNGYLQLAMAEFYRVQKKYDESYKILRLAFQNSSINIDQKVRILAPYFSNTQDSTAMQQATELSQLLTISHPTEAKSWAIYGDFLYQKKELDKARLSYQECLKLDQKVFAVWQNLLFIEAEQADYKSLLETSNAALEYYPANQLVFYMNAVAKSQTKDHRGAVEAYQQALNLTINNKELEAQIYAGLGDAYHSLNEHAKSDESYEKALDLRPDDPYVLNNYAYYLSLRNEQLEKALGMSKKSNELLKNNSSFLDTYAWIFFKLKRYQEAQIWIEAAVLNGGEKSATIAEHYGDIMFFIGDKVKAVDEWKRALELGAEPLILKKKIENKEWYE